MRAVTTRGARVPRAASRVRSAVTRAAIARSARSSSSPTRSRVEASWARGSRSARVLRSPSRPRRRMATVAAAAADARRRAVARIRPTSWRSGTTSSAAADGVAARTSAAKSASVTSTSWPTPVTTGSGCATTARTTRSSLNGQRSSMDPPPRARMVTAGASLPRPSACSCSTNASRRRNAATMDDAAPSPCTRQATSRSRVMGQRRARTVWTSCQTAPVGEVMIATVRGCTGRRRLRAASKRPSAARRALSSSKRIARLPTPAGCSAST